MHGCTANYHMFLGINMMVWAHYITVCIKKYFNRINIQQQQ